MKLSRSKVELFLECPKCFYYDVVLKKGRPSGFPLNLNNAIDLLLKKEFDLYRNENLIHPVQMEAGITFKPAKHEKLDQWRSTSLGGVSHFNAKHNCTYFGIIDDLWVNDTNQFAIVDYKSTAKEKPVKELPLWADSYKRQLSFYNYLLKKNGLDMFEKGFLVYTTALLGEEKFDNNLKFSTHVISVDLDLDWIDPTFEAIQTLLERNEVPQSSENCKFCSFVNHRIEII